RRFFLSAPLFLFLFHDINFHRPIHLHNDKTPEFASLTEKGVFIATKEKISFLPLGGLSRTGKWSLSFGKEEIVGMAADNTRCYVLTKDSLLRTVSTEGIQENVLLAPGNVVAMAANNSSLLLFSETKTTALSSLYTFPDLGINTAHIPIKNILWLGFDREGSPAFYTDEKMLFVFSIRKSLWLPVASTNKNIWPVGIEAGSLFFVPLGEEKEHPDAKATHQVHTQALSVPLLEQESAFNKTLARKQTREAIGLLRDTDTAGGDKDILEMAKAAVNENETHKIEYLADSLAEEESRKELLVLLEESSLSLVAQRLRRKWNSPAE
ncbi:MAG: uncharacterized protein A8A55_1546, partial [Amphiamblys sp. WSBS2006]